MQSARPHAHAHEVSGRVKGRSDLMFTKSSIMGKVTVLQPPMLDGLKGILQKDTPKFLHVSDIKFNAIVVHTSIDILPPL